MKKCLIVYHSYHHGNTEKIAHAMADATQAKACTATQALQEDLAEYEVIGLGAGIAFNKHYEKLLTVVQKLALQGKQVFVFSTSGTGSVKCHAELLALLKNQGAVVKGNFVCKGFDTFGPFKLVGGIAKGRPNMQDIANAQAFAKEMLQ